MPTYATILSAIVPVFLVMAAGFAMHKAGWMARELETGFMKLALNLLVPCLILDVVLGNPALNQASVVAWSIGLGFAIIVISFLVAYGVAWVFRLKRGSGLRTFALAGGIQNYGFVALPVLAILYASRGDGPLGVNFIHGLGVELAMWTVGILMLGQRSGPPWKLLINGPFIAVTGSLILNAFGAAEYIPGVIMTAIHMLGETAIPLCIFMIGATIAELANRQVFSDAARTATASIILRLALLPVIILALAKFLPLPDDLKRVLVVQAGMPSAIMPIVIARLYGGHPVTAVQVVLATTAGSIVAAPFIIAQGIRWVGVGS